MSKLMLFTIVVLVFLKLTGFDQLQLHMLAVLGLLLFGGLRLLLQQKLPTGFFKDVILLFIGPLVLVVVLAFFIDRFRVLNNAQASFLLLAVGCTLFLLAKKSR